VLDRRSHASLDPLAHAVKPSDPWAVAAAGGCR
jgi:hypothetical protein